MRTNTHTDNIPHAFPYGLGSQGPLLQFSSKGFRVSNQITPGRRFVALMTSLADGWVKFDVDGQPIEHHFGLIENDYVAPDRKALGDSDPNFWDSERDPWHRVVSITLIPPDDGERLTFTASTAAEINAIKDLAWTYDQHLKRFPDLMPIVEPGVDDQGAPEFRVVSWAMRGS